MSSSRALDKLRDWDEILMEHFAWYLYVPEWHSNAVSPMCDTAVIWDGTQIVAEIRFSTPISIGGHCPGHGGATLSHECALSVYARPGLISHRASRYKPKRSPYTESFVKTETTLHSFIPSMSRVRQSCTYGLLNYVRV